MKRFITIILTLLIAIIFSLGATTLLGCGQTIEPDDDDLPIVTPDRPSGSGGDNGGEGNGSGDNSGGATGGGGGGSDITLSPMPVP